VFPNTFAAVLARDLFQIMIRARLITTTAPWENPWDLATKKIMDEKNG
jgi:hypothetical protein